MKPKIHPKYQEVKYSCSCGYTFTVRSTLAVKEKHIDICSECHPFYTGKQKRVDTAGRIDRFNKKFGRKKEKTDTKK